MWCFVGRRQEDNQAERFLLRFLIERPAAVTSWDAILPHFGSVVWLWNGDENFSRELFWRLRENFVTFTCLLPGVIKHFFQVTLGFESNEDRAIVFFVLVYPGIFFTSLHTCASMNRWHRRRDAINKPYSGVYCTGLQVELLCACWHGYHFPHSLLYFLLEFSSEQWSVEAPRCLESSLGETPYAPVDISSHQTAVSLLPSKQEKSLKAGGELLKIQEHGVGGRLETI